MSSGNTVNPQTRSVQMDTDLSAKTNYLATLDATDENIVNLAAAATAPVFVITEGKDGSSTVATGSICIGGETKVICGGTVTAGDRLTSDGSGKAVATVTDHQFYGLIALENGVSNDVIRALFVQGQVSA